MQMNMKDESEDSNERVLIITGESSVMQHRFLLIESNIWGRVITIQGKRTGTIYIQSDTHLT